MTIAVTGAAGFVGTHVIAALAAAGETVVAVDRVRPRSLPADVRFVQLDLIDVTASSYDELGGPDTLLHLAWGGLPNYLSLHHIERELPLHYAFLATMARAGLRAMTVIGTCYEYGMENGELVEDMLPRPDNPYAYAKVALYEQLRYLRGECGFSLTWPRLFYMWGAGQASTSLYPLLRAAIERGDDSFPMSAGEQLRDYLPVHLVADHIADLTRLRCDAGIVNVCSGRPVSIRSLVERWIAEEGASISPALGRYPYPAYEALAFWGSTAKLQALLAQL